MKNSKTISTIVLVPAIFLLILTISFGSFYSYWNTASPLRTCASCHEIESQVHLFSNSSHRELSCSECHGTALSNGFHSMKEKAVMVINHVNKDQVEDIRMNETQLLEVMDQCERCHTSEFASWSSGGHSATYEDIFLNETHNKREQLNFDCLRCHGMFYEGTIADLVQPLEIKGPWELKNKEKEIQPVMPCMACHQIHELGDITKRPDYGNPSKIFYSREVALPGLGFYDRHEKVNVPAEILPKLKLFEGEKPVVVSDDSQMRICVQCHAPNGWHEAGTSDDRTPTGVHEGLSCQACHSPHSNNARSSCNTCHPKISNCGLDVTTMNTTYMDKNSLHNIHTVSCKDCHPNFNNQVIASSKSNL
jgi:hypothetical protein